MNMEATMTQPGPRRPLPDHSTLDVRRLDALATYTLPPSYHLQDEPGNGCLFDPPGYPTYFTRSVYTRHGNSPRRGPEEVISLLGKLYVTRASTDWRKGDTWETVQARHEARMMRLWVRLPLEHPRVQAWIVAVHQHLKHCYVDDAQVAEPFENGRPAMIIFPVPSYKLRSFHDDARFSDDWRAKEKAAIEAHNASVRERYGRVVSLDTHAAVRRIRRFYPEYQPDLHLSAERAERSGDWWARYAERPTPEQCFPPRWLGAHRTSGWCQFCGHVSVAA